MLFCYVVVVLLRCCVVVFVAVRNVCAVLWCFLFCCCVVLLLRCDAVLLFCGIGVLLVAVML